MRPEHNQISRDKNKSKRKISIEQLMKKKKNKSNFSKIKSQLEKTIKTKKIMQFVKSSARSIPHLLLKEQPKYLLPKLQKVSFQTKNNATFEKNNLRFKEVQGNLTNSLVLFTQKQSIQNTDLWAIQLQTQKCYKTIPKIFFNAQISNQQLKTNLKLTRDVENSQQNMYTLMDYLDQVQFNINQQVDAKLKIYTEFVLCMNSIQDLVSINLEKLSETRKKIKLLRDITVSRLIGINQNRMKMQKLQGMAILLEKLKKMKQLQSRLNSQIMVGNFIPHDPQVKIGAIYQEYCQIHNNQLMKICCQNGASLCKYWDVTYYVQKGFQEQFNKILQNYILEIFEPTNDLDKYKRAFTINKKAFMTTPGNFSNMSQNGSSIIDESYETIDHVQLVVKQNNQRQISKIFASGMKKYNFSTQKVMQALKNKLYSYFYQFIEEIGQQTISSDKINMQKLLNQPQNIENYLETSQCNKNIRKLSWVKYQKFLQIMIARMQNISHRIFSIVNRIISQAIKIEDSQPERYQIITSFMIQLIIKTFSQIDHIVCKIINFRLIVKTEDESFPIFKSKTNCKEYDLEQQNMKAMIKLLKKFELVLEKLIGTYPLAKSELENILTLNHQGQQASCCFKDCFPDLKQMKVNLVNIAYESLHRNIISKQLREKLQEETWQPIQISTIVYEQIGYIIGGKQFVFQQERKSRKMLSSSILLQKNSSEIDSQPAKYNKEGYSSRFRVNNQYITIDMYQFRLIRSTVQIIGFLKHYLELYDETIDIDKKFELHGKITQFVLMYNQYIKQLILKSQALKYGKIKSKSITAKHLLICYIQLTAIDLIFCGRVLQQRINISSQQSHIMRQKLSQTCKQIKQRYRKILEMRIIEYIEGINLKEDILESQQFLTIPKNFISSFQLFKDLLLKQEQYAQFIDIDTKWTAQLLNKVSKGSKGKQRKNKAFTYIEQELMYLYEYLPKLKIVIKGVLN